MKCCRCGFYAIIETIEGLRLCSSCESVYNNILNEPLEDKTLNDFKREIKDYKINIVKKGVK